MLIDEGLESNDSGSFLVKFGRRDVDNLCNKQRKESKELLILKALDKRMLLKEKDKRHFLHLKKGYDGEKRFDEVTESLLNDCYILNDLLLPANGTVIQLDAVIITSEQIYLFEIKNYEGNYYYEKDRFYTIHHKEIANPLNQLRRSETILRQLLLGLGWNNPMSSAVVFINPEFTLYQAPITLPFIFPTQINRHFAKIKTTSRTLTERHRLLAEKLISLHIEDSPFIQLPNYEYSQLKKGMICKKCSSFSLTVDGKLAICQQCGIEESIEEAIIRSVTEFTLLFPERKITTKGMEEWCSHPISYKRIKRILEKYYRYVPSNRWSYFE